MQGSMGAEATGFRVSSVKPARALEATEGWGSRLPKLGEEHFCVRPFLQKPRPGSGLCNK